MDALQTPVVAKRDTEGYWVLGEVGRDTGSLFTWIHWPNGHSRLVDRPRLARYKHQGERALIDLGLAR